jgi:hypothetical protein
MGQRNKLVSSEGGKRVIMMVDDSPYDAALCLEALDDEVEDTTTKDCEDVPCMRRRWEVWKEHAARRESCKHEARSFLEGHRTFSLPQHLLSLVTNTKTGIATENVSESRRM